jgi:hypothetical protein
MRCSTTLIRPILFLAALGLLLVPPRLGTSNGDPRAANAKDGPEPKQTPDIQEQLKALELGILQAAANHPEVTDRPFGQITRVSPEGQIAKSDFTPIVSAGYVGLSPNESHHYRFDLLVRVEDEHGKSILTGCSSTTVAPGSTQDLTLVISHIQPKPGKYEVSTLIRARSLPPRKDRPSVDVSAQKTYRYTVK